MPTFEYNPPKHAIGTKFIYKRGGKTPAEATIVGYHIEFDTDTDRLNVTYRVTYEFAGQPVTANVPRATVDRALL